MLKRCDMRFHVCSVTYVFVFLCAFYFLFCVFVFWQVVVPNAYLQMCSTNVFCSDELFQMRTYKCVLFRWVVPNAYLQMCLCKCVLFRCVVPKCVLTDVLYKCVLFRWVGPQMRTYRCALQMCSVQMRCPKMRFSKLAYLWGLRACFFAKRKVWKIAVLPLIFLR